VHQKREGRTVIFSTHVMSQAEEVCDYIFLINKGKKVLDGTLAQVKAGGQRGIQVDYDGDGSFLRTLRGVRRINDAGKTAELFLEDGIDPQEILQQMVSRLQIRRFDLRDPSLHEVFVRAVGGNSNE